MKQSIVGTNQLSLKKSRISSKHFIIPLFLHMYCSTTSYSLASQPLYPFALLGKGLVTSLNKAVRSLPCIPF